MYDKDADTLEAMFAKLDGISMGTDHTAVVHLQLANGSQMSIKAGGAGVGSYPSSPPFSRYEVLVSSKPPRFWRRFAGSDYGGSMYVQVPKLLICHQVIRVGGMFGHVYEIHTVSRKKAPR